MPPHLHLTHLLRHSPWNQGLWQWVPVQYLTQWRPVQRIHLVFLLSPYPTLAIFSLLSHLMIHPLPTQTSCFQFIIFKVLYAFFVCSPYCHFTITLPDFVLFSYGREKAFSPITTSLIFLVNHTDFFIPCLIWGTRVLVLCNLQVSVKALTLLIFTFSFVFTHLLTVENFHLFICNSAGFSVFHPQKYWIR